MTALVDRAASHAYLERTQWLVRVPATLVGPALLPVTVAMFLRMRDGLGYGVISNLIGALALAIGIAQLLVFRRRERILQRLNFDQKAGGSARRE